jgi:hypothetical protein
MTLSHISHKCPHHGLFAGGCEVSYGAETAAVFCKQSMSNGIVPSTDRAQCCLLGLNDDVSITGEPWTNFDHVVAGIPDEEVCEGLKCFWLKSNREPVNTSTESTEWSELQLHRLRKLMTNHCQQKRGACAMAITLRKPCNEVSFCSMLHKAQQLTP